MSQYFQTLSLPFSTFLTGITSSVPNLDKRFCTNGAMGQFIS